MTIEQTLAEMRDLMRRRSDLMEKLERAECSATSTGGIGDGMPRPTDVTSKVETGGILIGEIKKDIAELELQLDLYARIIKPAIEMVRDSSARIALNLRYIERKPMAYIASILHYDKNYIYEYMRDTAEKHLKAS